MENVEQVVEEVVVEEEVEMEEEEMVEEEVGMEDDEGTDTIWSQMFWIIATVLCRSI